MNFPTPNHLKFTDTTFLTIAGLLIFQLFIGWKGNSKTTFSVADTGPAVSQAISWDEAVQMKNMFTELSPMMIDIPDGRGSKSVPLEGFKMDANQLLELINSNKNGGKADEVMFYFGAKPSATGTGNPMFNIIAVGMKNNNLMIPATSEGKSNPESSSIFDKADPCPPMCPNE